MLSMPCRREAADDLLIDLTRLNRPPSAGPTDCHPAVRVIDCVGFRMSLTQFVKSCVRLCHIAYDHSFGKDLFSHHVIEKRRIWQFVTKVGDRGSDLERLKLCEKGDTFVVQPLPQF